MNNRELLFEQRLSDYEYLRQLYRSGALGGLNQYERELLEFCHNTDMPKYLKENVWDKPIVLDDEGNVDYTRTVYKSNNPNIYQQPLPTQQQFSQPTPQVTPQKFYYLYDDNGNLIAAIPQR